jgi:hypothetical protein
LLFLDHFYVLKLKIIFLKNIILIHFRVNNTLKNNYNHTSKHPLNILYFTYHACLIWKIRLQIFNEKNIQVLPICILVEKI